MVVVRVAVGVVMGVEVGEHHVAVRGGPDQVTLKTNEEETQLHLLISHFIFVGLLTVMVLIAGFSILFVIVLYN